MAGANYCIASGTPHTDDLTDPSRIRAAALGCSVLCVGDPTGLITVWPSVAVLNSAGAPVIIPDDSGQATASEVSTALTAAEAAENAAAATITQANANLANLLNNMQVQITQARTDITTLSTSPDPIAPIVSRNIEASLAIAQGLADTLVALKMVAASEVPATGA